MRNHALRAALWSLASCLFVSFLACGDDDGPTDPGPGAGDAVASGSVGASGGTIIAGDGSFTLTIPAGALAATTDVTVREIDAVDLGLGTTLRSFDFEPDDLVFGADVTLAADLPGVLARRRVRRYEAPCPVVTVTSPGLTGTPAIRQLVDSTVRVSHVPPGSSGVQFNLRGIDDGLVSILVPGAPVAGGPTIDFEIVTTETTVDVLTSGLIGNTTVVDLETSSPAIFGASATTGAVLIATRPGDGLTPAIADGQPLTFVTSGVDGETGRNLVYRQFGASVADGLEDGFTARLSYGIRHVYDADLTNYWDSETDLTFEATFEQEFDELQIPVDVGDDPGDFFPGVYAVGDGVDGFGFAYAIDEWRYQDAIFVNTSSGTRVLGSDFVALDGIFNDPGVYGVHIGAWRAELDTGLPSGIAMFRYGNGFDGQTAWDYESDDFGFTQLDINAGNVTDINPYDGNPLSGGIVKVQERAGGFSRVDFYEFDGDFWNFGGRIDQFPDALGPAITAVRRSMGAALIATGGETSQLFLNEVGESPGASTLIGTLGDDVRQMRFSGELAFASLFGSGTIRPISWPIDGTPTILDPVAVGDGPISFDVKRLPNDNRVLVSAGFGDDTLWRTEFSPAGLVISNQFMDLPDGVEAPSTVRFVPGDSGLLAVNGFATGNIAILEFQAGQ